ncbi:MAG: tyrosine-type recombinase/integrase, partial [Endomicrobium sp.]|nr:tyrosine-type recombinase/integrase [Endomicrobium sp.]
FCNEDLNYAKTNKRERTALIDSYAIKRMLAYLEQCRIIRLKDINSKHLEDFKISRSKTLKPSSVNRELDTIKALFRKAVEWKYIAENPAKPIKPLKISLRQPRFLSKQEAQNLIKASSGFLRTMIMISLYTGFRLSEVFNLQFQDIDFNKDTISVNPKHGFIPKNYEFRTIPLNKELREYLIQNIPKIKKGRDYLFKDKNDDISISALQTSVKQTFKKANIKEASFHTLRHTFASWLVIGGINLYTVSQLLVHSDVKTTMIYAHLSKEHLKNSVDLLTFKN